MNVEIAHDLKEKDRTQDIKISENVEFSAMLLSENVQKGLQKCGFQKPSPIQLKAIPLGRCGFDLIIKAKSGTGKTAVFVITALEMVNLAKNSVQVVILGPTREIAVQIQQVVKHIGCELKGLGVEYFIGGTPIAEDEKKIVNCHIVVGAPGRIKHLIEKKTLDVTEVRLFILDEVDKLMNTSLQQKINWIYNKLPKRKQVIAVSATYPEDLDKFLGNYMLSLTHVSPESKLPVLLGIRQFYTEVKSHLNTLQQMKFKTEELVKILSNLSFNQCLVFSNYQTRAESLSNNLNQQGWPSRFISGQQEQSERLQVVDDLRKFKCRILSSTDLTARGIDAANVDLVINYDVPIDVETYLHRMGRAGRYGSYGICITIAAEGKDVKNLQKIIRRLGNNVIIAQLPETKLFKDIWRCDLASLEQLPPLDDDITEIKGNNNSENKSVILTKNLSVDKDKEHEKTIQKDETLEVQSDSKENVINNALTQISELLTKPYNPSIHDTDVKNINSLLENLKSRMSLENNEKLKDVSQSDNKTILKKLSTGTVETKIKTDTHENKKSKLHDVVVITQGDSQVFNKEASNFQQNMILRKNIALFSITKLIMENKCSDMYIKDCSKEVHNLLEILKEEDLITFKNYTADDISSFLQSYNIQCKDKKIVPGFKIPRVEKDITEPILVELHKQIKEDTSCECPENLFSTVYDMVLSNHTLNWRDKICGKHRSQEIQTEKEKCAEKSLETSLIYEDDNENSVMELDESISFVNSEMLNENLFTEAYDRAIQDKIKEYRSTESLTEIKNEPFGYTADNYYSKKFVHFTNVNKNIDNVSQGTSKKQLSKKESYVSPELQSFIERRNVYASYYQHYSNVLAETAPTFTDVNNFHMWFAKWREEVDAVRDFVQQDIFQKECNKHK